MLLCGIPTALDRTQFGNCLPEMVADHLKEMVAGAHDRLREMRKQGVDPVHGGEAALKRGATNRVHQDAAHEWNKNNDQSPRSRFTEEIFPLLEGVPLSLIAETTVHTKGYCSFIKRGIKIPHERHWESLHELGIANSPNSYTGLGLVVVVDRVNTKVSKPILHSFFGYFTMRCPWRVPKASHSASFWDVSCFGMCRGRIEEHQTGRTQ